MLVRLSGAKRLRAGRLVALVYLLCMLAPTLSFALAVSPCLAVAEQGIMHVHAASHVQAEEHVRDHAMAHSHASAPDHGASVQAPTPSDRAPLNGSHSHDGKCCGLTCLSPLPATLVDVVTPSVPRASTEVERSSRAAPLNIIGPPSLDLTAVDGVRRQRRCRLVWRSRKSPAIDGEVKKIDERAAKIPLSTVRPRASAWKSRRPRSTA